MNKIIKHTGEYLANYFKGKQGIWDIISTDAGIGGAMKCIDTFKSRETGELLPVEREKVYKWAEAGSIFLDTKSTSETLNSQKDQHEHDIRRISKIRIKAKEEKVQERDGRKGWDKISFHQRSKLLL